MSRIKETPEDAATLAALRECRELGVVPSQFVNGSWIIRKDGRVYGGDTLPEALAAYKTAQAPEVPQVEDG